MNQTTYHIPALLHESLNALDIKPSGIYVDATFGGGGHSSAILAQLNSDGHIYAFDQDEDAIKRASSHPQITLIHGNFRYLHNFLRYYQVGKVDGILADLGVSFHHFDDAQRGFSFRNDSLLDMRMNRRAKLTAAHILNNYDEKRLAGILKLYGEVQRSNSIAAAIIAQRAKSPIKTTGQLIDIVIPFIDKRHEKKDLACIFQALRIEVNGELDALKGFLAQAVEELKPGGRLAILTYHSLEDRLVKNFMRSGNFDGISQTDIYGNSKQALKPLTSKPITPSEKEILDNPRSRSAKLRVARKI